MPKPTPTPSASTRGASRRALLLGAPLATACATASAHAPDLGALEADLQTYAEFGSKNAGGEADNASGAWLERRLAEAGFATQRQQVEAAHIFTRTPRLRIGAAEADVECHDLGAAAAVDTVEGPLSIWGAHGAQTSAAPGAIVVAHLPHQRWSSALHPAIRSTVAAAFAQGASALVLVTHGPTRELIRLNRSVQPEPYPGPVVLAAPRAWAALSPSPAQGQRATLSLGARASERPAFNVVARIDRGGGPWVVVSTPRSGWTISAAERGPGIAILLALASWLPARFPQRRFLFVATSAHEYENAGGKLFLERLAPDPDSTALWLHLGAGFAARDWHEAGERLLPLPSADPQRFLVTSPYLLDAARAAFAGVAGLEAPYPSTEGGAGELREIVAAGHRAVFGMLGAHRRHHVSNDNMDCVDARHTCEVLLRLQSLLEETLS